MAHDNTPPMPDFPPSAQKESRTNLVVITSAAAVIAAVIGTGIMVVNSGDDGSKPTVATKSTGEAAVTAAAAEPDPTPTYDEVDADSFTIKLKTTSRQCFGSAG